MQKPFLKGDVVVSKAGHDTSRMYVVITDEAEGFVTVADGEYRKAKNPKRKRGKHLRFKANEVLPENPKDTDIKLILKKWRDNAQRG